MPVVQLGETVLTVNGEVLVEFSAVEKTYDGEVNVVERLELRIFKGEFLTLLGPSGSGKTTTLMMLAGFEDLTAGDISLRGNSLVSVPPHRRNMGVVFQNYALFPHMSVAENVAYPLKRRGLAKAEIRQRTEQALRMVELEHLGMRRSAQLSGGQQQRVALARALVFEPDLVLMDEPLGALDKKLREQMQLEIKHLHEQLKMTVVYVTHDQGEALTMSDRVAVFSDGIIQQIDTPRAIYESPNNAFVANFIGENNNLDGEIIASDDDNCQVRLDTGETVGCRIVEIADVGARTSLSLRPERLRLRPVGDANANRVLASVEEIIYGGDHSMVRLRRSDGSPLVVMIGAAEMDDIEAGASIEVGWQTKDCRALDPYSS